MRLKKTEVAIVFLGDVFFLPMWNFQGRDFEVELLSHGGYFCSVQRHSIDLLSLNPKNSTYNRTVTMNLYKFVVVLLNIGISDQSNVKLAYSGTASPAKTGLISISLTFQSLDTKSSKKLKKSCMSGGVHVLLLPDWMKSELFSLSGLAVRHSEGKRPTGATTQLASTRLQNVHTQGETVEQQDVNELWKIISARSLQCFSQIIARNILNRDKDFALQRLSKHYFKHACIKH